MACMCDEVFYYNLYLFRHKKVSFSMPCQLTLSRCSCVPPW